MSDECRYRTKEEMIRYFERLSYEFEVLSVRESENSEYFKGKADAYKMAAFELKRNME